MRSIEQKYKKKERKNGEEKGLLLYFRILNRFQRIPNTEQKKKIFCTEILSPLFFEFEKQVRGVKLQSKGVQKNISFLKTAQSPRPSPAKKEGLCI